VQRYAFSSGQPNERISAERFRSGAISHASFAGGCHSDGMCPNIFVLRTMLRHLMLRTALVEKANDNHLL